MINTATADNIRHLNTTRRAPKAGFDPAARRAHLAANVDKLCKQHRITDAADINAYVRLAMSYLENGYTSEAAFGVVKSSLERVAPQIEQIIAQDHPATAETSIVRLVDRFPTHYHRRPAKRRSLKTLARYSGLIVCALIAGIALHELPPGEPGAQPGKILAKSEIKAAGQPLPMIAPAQPERR